MSDIAIDRMQPGEAAEAAAVLSHALQTSPSTVAVCGGSGEDVRRSMEAMIRIASVERPFANVVVARQDGRIVGAFNALEYPHCRSSPLAKLGLLPTMLKLGLEARTETAFPGGTLKG